MAAGLVSFALGTDTAGSGRVPAAFNNLVGLKPTLRPAQHARRGARLPLARLRFDFRANRRVTRRRCCASRAASMLTIPTRAARRRSPKITPTSFAGCRFGVPRHEQLEFFGNADAAQLFEAQSGDWRARARRGRGGLHAIFCKRAPALRGSLGGGTVCRDSRLHRKASRSRCIR